MTKCILPKVLFNSQQVSETFVCTVLYWHVLSEVAIKVFYRLYIAPTLQCCVSDTEGSLCLWQVGHGTNFNKPIMVSSLVQT